MTVLVTGATGFTGTALVRYLRNLGIRDIAGLARSAPADPDRQSRVRIVACDLLDRPRIHTVMADLNPDCIIHLAGLNRGAPDELFRANVTGMQNLLDAVHEANPSCRILIVSSSAVYGYAGKKPIDEDTPVKPLGDYGASKAEQERIALAYHATKGAQVAIARPFNLVGPGQPASFVCGRIVRQVVEIEQGKSLLFRFYDPRALRVFLPTCSAQEVRQFFGPVASFHVEDESPESLIRFRQGLNGAEREVVALVRSPLAK